MDTTKRVLDFRSDTVTRPHEAMRAAMAAAVVGDDVLGDDPTVKELERRFAATLGKEAALFCPSGSMCNLIALCIWTRPGDEVVMEERTHTFVYEGAGSARFAHVQTRTFARASGVPQVEDLVRSLRNPRDIHQPRSKLFVVENTHNVAGGRIVPRERIRELSEVAHAHGMRVHVDGARLFNAAVATHESVADIVAPVDSVMCCLSKGLGAPIGSCLAGPQDFIDEARRVRKALGGGMRQAGIIAAAAILALEEGPALLERDHARARRFWQGLAAVPGLAAPEPETNMVRVEVDAAIGAKRLAEACAARGLLVFAMTEEHLRFVFHRDQRDDDVDAALAILSSLCAPRAAS